MMINPKKNSEEAAVDKEEYDSDMTLEEFFKTMSDCMLMDPDSLHPDLMVVVDARNLAKVTNLILLANASIANPENHHLLSQISDWIKRDVSSFMKSFQSIQQCLDEHEEYIFGELLDNEWSIFSRIDNSSERIKM